MTFWHTELIARVRDPTVPRRSFLSRQLVDAPGGFLRGTSAFLLTSCVLIASAYGWQQYQDAAFLKVAQPRLAYVIAVHHHYGRSSYDELDVLLSAQGTAAVGAPIVASHLDLSAGDQTHEYSKRRVISVLVDPAHPGESRLAADPASATAFLLIASIVAGVLGLLAAVPAVRMARGQRGWQAQDAGRWRRADDGNGAEVPLAPLWQGPGRRVSVLLPDWRRRTGAGLALGGIALAFLLLGIISAYGSLPYFAVLAALCLLLVWRIVGYRAVIEPDGTLVVGARPLGRRVALQRAMVRTRSPYPMPSAGPTSVSLELGEPGQRPVTLVLAMTGKGGLRVLVDPAALPVLGAGLACSPSRGARDIGGRLQRMHWQPHEDASAWQQLPALSPWC